MRVCLVQNTQSPLAQKIPTTCSGAGRSPRFTYARISTTLRRELELLSASSRSPQTSVAPLGASSSPRGARTAYPPPSPGPAVALAGQWHPWGRVLCLSEPPNLGDVLLLDVPHVKDVLGVIQLQGAEQPPLQSLPEIIWPCRHLQGLEGVVKHPCLVGVLGALVRLLRLLNGAHRISQCLAGVDTLTSRY